MKSTDTESVQIVDRIRELLQPVPGLRLALLYGSTATGKMRGDSDVDVAVLFDRPLDAATAERMVKAVGFRNTAVHAYQEIDWEIVYRIVTLHLGDFRDFPRQIRASIA